MLSMIFCSGRRVSDLTAGGRTAAVHLHTLMVGLVVSLFLVPGGFAAAATLDVAELSILPPLATFPDAPDPLTGEDEVPNLTFTGITDGQTVTADALYVTVEVARDDVDYVRFYRDGQFVRRESFAPYSLNGDANQTPNPYDITGLGPGEHTITADAVYDDGTSESRTVTFFR